MDIKKQAPLASLRDRLTQYMEERSMRKTPERYEILRVAGLASGIFTIDELMNLMKEQGEFQVSRATIFNTMELFVDAGIVIKHPLATAAHYEMRTDCNPKAYVICRQCNTITKVSTSTARLALVNLHVRYFGIEDKLLYMHGLCRKCQAKNRQEARKKNLNKQDKNNNGKRKS
ncbi:MAG: transcriptional repressor [Bacteroidaceae bacterium]|nr:transcriptional repressor [Bacteroidaceae bacterium]MBQ9293658.1 transcriptional repressor [Bacteroidaceae bacterium]